MKELEKVITHSEFVLTQVAQTEHGYIYAKSYEPVIAKQVNWDKPISYEVFRREVQHAGTSTIKGVEIHYEEKVLYPSTTKFGTSAFDCRTLEKAQLFLDSFGTTELVTEEIEQHDED